MLHTWFRCSVSASGEQDGLSDRLSAFPNFILLCPNRGFFSCVCSCAQCTTNVPTSQSQPPGSMFHGLDWIHVNLSDAAIYISRPLWFQYAGETENSPAYSMWQANAEDHNSWTILQHIGLLTSGYITARIRYCHIVKQRFLHIPGTPMSSVFSFTWAGGRDQRRASSQEHGTEVQQKLICGLCYLWCLDSCCQCGKNVIPGSQ